MLFIKSDDKHTPTAIQIWLVLFSCFSFWFFDFFYFVICFILFFIFFSLWRFLLRLTIFIIFCLFVLIIPLFRFSFVRFAFVLLSTCFFLVFGSFLRKKINKNLKTWIVYFRVPKTLTFKTRLSAKPFLRKRVYEFYWKRIKKRQDAMERTLQRRGCGTD